MKIELLVEIFHVIKVSIKNQNFDKKCEICKFDYLVLVFKTKIKVELTSHPPTPYRSDLYKKQGILPCLGGLLVSFTLFATTVY